MSKKKITTREKAHNRLDSVLDFIANTKEKTSKIAGKIIDYRHNVADAVIKGKDFVADKADKTIKPIKLKFELDKRAKSIGYGAILGDIANKIKKGITLTEEESFIYKKISNENL